MVRPRRSYDLELHPLADKEFYELSRKERALMAARFWRLAVDTDWRSLCGSPWRRIVPTSLPTSSGWCHALLVERRDGRGLGVLSVLTGRARDLPEGAFAQALRRLGDAPRW